jgi:hypothetical protein
MDATCKRILLELEGLSHKPNQSISQAPSDAMTLIDEMFRHLLEDKGERELSQQGQEIRDILTQKLERPLAPANVPILWLWFCAFSFYELDTDTLQSRLFAVIERCKQRTAVSDSVTDRTDYLLLDFRRELWIKIVKRISVTSLPIVELFSSVTTVVDEISMEQDPILWTPYARTLAEIGGALSLLDFKMHKVSSYL